MRNNPNITKAELSRILGISTTAIDNNVTVFTCLDTVKVLLDVLEEITMGISVIDKE